MKKPLHSNTFSHFFLLASPTITFILGLFITLFATYFVYSTAYEKEYIEFETATQSVLDKSTSYVDLHTGLLYAVRSFVLQNQDLTQEEFAAYVKEFPLGEIYGGLQSIGYSKMYTKAELSQLPENIPFTPNVEQSEHHVVLVAESPSSISHSDVGYDLFTDPIKKKAMERARDTGTVTISSILNLTRDVDGVVTPGFVLFLPVYSTSVVPPGVDTRRESLEGYVYISIQTNEFFMQAFESRPPEGASFTISDRSLQQEKNILFQWKGENESHPKFRFSQTVSVLGADWFFEFSSRASSASMANWWFSPMVLGVGLVLTYSLYLTTRYQVGARIRAEASEYELSESKRELEASEQRLKMLVEGVKDYAIIMLSPKGQILSWNSGAHSMLDFTESEAIGQPYTMFFLEKKRRKNDNPELREAVQEGRVNFERNFIQKSGMTIWVSGVINALYDGRKKLRGFALIARDTTTRMLTENELQRSKALNEAILASLPAHLAVLDSSGNVLQSNKSWKSLMKQIHKEKPGLALYEENLLDWWRYQIIKANSKIDQIVRGIIQVQKGRKKSYTSEVGMTIKGKQVWFLLQVKALQHTDDGVIISLTDITIRKRLEKQKDEFMSIASHELKTPITSVKSYAQVLKRIFSDLKDKKSTALLDKMDVQLDKVTKLINDLLDITKIESGILQFNNETFKFDLLVKEVVDLVQMSASKHTFEVHLNADYTVYGDRDRIGQVISNLLTNAVKYSPEADTVVITTKKVGSAVECSVQDFGIGIPKEKQERLFEKFYRVTDMYPNTFHGMGLGLYIAKKIMMRSGGKILVKSKAGKGSTFTISLPIK